MDGVRSGTVMDSVCVLCVSIAYMAQTSSELHNHFPQRLEKNGLSLKHNQMELLCALQRLHLKILCELFI